MESRPHIKPKVLAVDDDPHMRSAIRDLLANDFEVLVAASPREAMGILHTLSLEDTSPIAMLLDIQMPEMTGLELLKILQQRYPELPVVMLTSNADTRSIVESMQSGASDYVVKGTTDFSTELPMRLAQTLSKQKLIQRNKQLESKLVHLSKPVDMVGNTHGALRIRTKISSVKGRDTTILVTGQSGTGKELVARLLNQQEGDKARPFIEINCSAIPEELAENELFGHEKGSFTSATEKQTGKFLEAQGGDIFLDEIGELPLAIQAKLLRVLQEKKVTPVGSTKSIPIAVRVIAATNRNLKDEVRAGRFREDLYYRITVFPIELPSLSERREDITILASHFARTFGGPHASISKEALKVLEKHSWPGNIRELRNCIERAWILTAAEGGSTIQTNRILLDPVVRKSSEDDVFVPTEKLIWNENDITPAHLDEYQKWAERTYFTAALKVQRNKTKLAEKLGVSKAYLFRQMKILGLND